jgi:hypothetical protein
MLLVMLVLAAPPTIGPCQILPSNHVFNTPIDMLPPHPSSDAFIATIGATGKKLHLDMGQDTDPTSASYWGIPYNTVSGNTITWQVAPFHSLDPDMSWNPADESDCADTSHALVRPCTHGNYLPIPATPLVEGGTFAEMYDAASSAWNYGDHHILLLDTDTCQLWETYHSYHPNAAGGWDIFGAAFFDLTKNALRPAQWTSADAAGFPILPLLLRASEASSGAINHALRFTINSSSTASKNKIRAAYSWPARHFTYNDMATTKPPMGQLFRLKASYQIPAGFGVQSKAILQALKTYGMYIADGGSDMYITGEPSADWADNTFTEVQSVTHTSFEAVDLSPWTGAAGFDPDSGAVPGVAAIPPSGGTSGGGTGGTSGSGAGSNADGSTGTTGSAAQGGTTTKRGGCGGAAFVVVPIVALRRRRRRS